MQDLLGPVNERDCLCIVAQDVIVSHQLMQGGGRWKCVQILEESGPIMDCLMGPDVDVLRDGKLPYDDDAFDAVVLDHVLEFFEEDTAFVEECHRVLKTTGVLVVQTPRAKA